MLCVMTRRSFLRQVWRDNFLLMLAFVSFFPTFQSQITLYTQLKLAHSERTSIPYTAFSLRNEIVEECNIPFQVISMNNALKSVV